MITINEVYDFLRKHQIVQSQEDFSSRFLRKSPRYYSMVKASDHETSIEAMNTLAARLVQIADGVEMVKNKNPLSDEAKRYSKRLSEYILMKSLQRQPNTHSKEVQNFI
ncbi:hypothetical protein MTBPR1_220005 [Candidatus Terasakiella magnetica]|uniref:Uncharacterized protein n=1 Tax=Candidatus Terasakiella magnetica TaxID=1867952 RepID=A0A1C3RH87_9PROT|nr:hypothetical protein MTBPR1_220005 [Candidatus Terasakiella magnetica]